MNKEVQLKFESYPPEVRSKMLELRTLIIEVIEECGFKQFEETLKWGEPSYLVNGGSTVRIDWKAKSPEQCYVFFNCKTKLVDTFRELYSDTLTFNGNRAISFNLDQAFPVGSLKHCIELSLRYQSIKHLPLLGV
ncbi:DUF1801 domain-containing protein [Vibrio kyushuensis]|uniref:DUF1801 domain-containing protein n=1 Tax=Vibrio kyushuensis TaxID=2910249 RepID=UPI003D0CF6F2